MTGGRILFLHANDAPFVRADRQILSEAYDIEEIDCSRGASIPQILRALRGVVMSYSWFALGYAARAVLGGKLLGRPSVVVAGGWDVASMPEISYGATRGRRGLVRARFILRRADTLLTFSESSRRMMQTMSGRDPIVVHLGVDIDRFTPREPKEGLVVTVGNVTRENLGRKGLETFVRSAAFLPDVPFVLAGAHVDDGVERLRSIATPNVALPGRLSDEDLQNLLGRAKVYVQVSYTEGFGLAVAEAMSCGCVPVVTAEGSLPEIVGESGLYAPYGDASATADVIRQALTSDRGPAARARVRDRFSLDRRRDRVLQIVEGVLEGRNAS